ncbi:MAG: EF-hand domain-containing protein [Phenylobacterium sp.]|uniref:EF-hand domain-containing protein n=1 Tax=Phenylobacterium sp. TaxID=1871053 RepID=UPI00271BF20C|nr:EF-hand domain-containing protein [Phenylobacterium sp.]MDO8901452.1 EF-hand domain-containing protein [Phenylobacterium sp.]MDP2215206.1 EF-hand domain-containing protein [Phenylobacterium sp.]
MYRKLLFSALALALLSTPVHAQMMGRAPDPDLNKDGKVTLAEFRKSQADSMLQAFDKNRDGQITRAEFKPMENMARRFRGSAGAAQAADIWTRLDANRDGVITRAEIEASAERRFAANDADKDGILDRAELTSLRQSLPSGGS